MQRVYTYLIQLDDNVDESEINAASPLRVTARQISSGTTLLAVCTDQSGLVGLLRHLHGRGFVFLALSCARGPDHVLLAGERAAAQSDGLD